MYVCNITAVLHSVLLCKTSLCFANSLQTFEGFNVIVSTKGCYEFLLRICADKGISSTSPSGFIQPRGELEHMNSEVKSDEPR